MIAEGEGRLGLDYSRVTRIRRVSVPESFVSRSEPGLPAPSQVANRLSSEDQTLRSRNLDADVNPRTCV